MQNGHNFLLQDQLHVDEKVAADNHVHLRKRWVTGQVLPGKDAHLPHRFVYAVPRLPLDEEAPHALRRYLFSNAFPVHSSARSLNAFFVQVGSEYLDLEAGGFVTKK